MSSSIHSDIANTVQVSGRRFEQSPYYEFYRNTETVLGVVADRYYGVFNGEDSVAAYWNLRRQSVLYDVPEKPWEIRGPDAQAFLEKIFARPVVTLLEGRGRYAIACTEEGGTFMDGILFKMEQDRYWYVQPDGPLKPWLLAHKPGFDIEINDPKSRVLQIQGPTSKKIVQDLTHGAIDDNMKYFHSGYFDIGGQELYVSRTGWTGELGYEVYSVGATTDHKKLWDNIIEAGKAHGMIYASMASMETRRIEAGILDNITDCDTTMNPFEAGLGPFIDLGKEGYIGRQALQTVNKDVLLLGLKCETNIPAYGGRVMDGSTQVGWVTAATWSPTLECGVGYVRFTEPNEWVGKSLKVETETDVVSECEIVPLPFYDTAKEIPRGIDTRIP